MSNKSRKQYQKKEVILPFWSKVFYIIILLLVMIAICMVVFLSWRDFISLINLNERVYFSWRVFFISFGFPIGFHFLFSIMSACISDTPRPYKGPVVSVLVWIF
ncbi:hypothetical protein [Xenorhabdus bharatensis]|uniref:hypothetical protein n=1 Tax=Xenorhabdus bharatensis TaxID=3136256 RepID=UPI0030F38D0F